MRVNINAVHFKADKKLQAFIKEKHADNAEEYMLACVDMFAHFLDLLQFQ